MDEFRLETNVEGFLTKGGTGPPSESVAWPEGIMSASGSPPVLALRSAAVPPPSLFMSSRPVVSSAMNA